MEKQSQEVAQAFLKNEVSRIERRFFIVKVCATVLAYAGTTYWLNSIRPHASTSFLWALILVQVVLYCSIFLTTFKYAQIYHLKNFGLAVFAAFIVGRVNDWELVTIPLIILLALTLTSNKVPVNSPYLPSA